MVDGVRDAAVAERLAALDDARLLRLLGEGSPPSKRTPFPADDLDRALSRRRRDWRAR